MKKVVMSVMISLDGFFDGTGEGFERIRWFRADQEWLDYSVELLEQTDTLLFGRRTFEGMQAYWPDQKDPVAEYMNALPKVCFSRTPKPVQWNNARLVLDAAGEVARLKQETGKELVIFGSADLAASLSAARLIDEYRIAVNPVVIGAGTPLFPHGSQLELQLIGTRTFRSGVAQLSYAPATP